MAAPPPPDLTRDAVAVLAGSQPYAQVGRSTSLDTGAAAIAALNKIRRIRSDRDYDEVLRSDTTAVAHMPDQPYEVLEKLVDAVWELLVHRLKFHGLWQDKAKKKHFRWLLPKSLEHEAQWRLLLEDPLAVTPDMLRVMLDLQPSTANDKPSPNQNVFYIRTFRIRATVLRRVIQGMLHDGHDSNTRMFAWLERTEQNATGDSDEYLTLRYIGQTKNKAWDRHHQDTYMKGLKSFMGHFYRQLGMDSPEVLKTATVEVLTHATATVYFDQEVLNRREQIMMVLFDNGALNTQIGGKDIIVLKEEDQHLFTILQTNTVALLDKTSIPTQPLRKVLAAWSKRVQAYSTDHPTTRQGHKKLHVFSDQIRTMILEQGLPRQLSDDSAVMVSVGSDLGDMHMEGEETFFAAEGRSAYALTYIYNHFGHWEADAASRFDITLAKRMAKEFKLPFVDVVPFFVKHEDDYSDASTFLGEYINHVRPLIVITYGGLPTYAGRKNFDSFTKSEFEADKKLGQRKYSKGHWVRDVMGRPRLQNFESGTHPDSGWFVLIPCCHPGLHGHIGGMKDELTRLLVMTLCLSWIAMTWAIQMDLDADFQLITRKEKCQTIIRQLEVILAEGHEFGKAFALAKKNYEKAHKLWTESRALHKQDIRLKQPSRFLLPGKTLRVRRAYKVDEHETVDACSELFDVTIVRYTTPAAPIARDYRYRLTWSEGGQQWSIAPVILPNDTLPTAYSGPASSADKFSICYTPGGIDIRNSAGKSLSTRQPLLNHQCRLETIPIASLVITLSEGDYAEEFLSHWETITSTSVAEALIDTLPPGIFPTALPHSTSDSYYPESFFSDSKTSKAMTFTAKVFKRNTGGVIYFNKAKTYLPANVGDLFFLIDRFFADTFPEGGDVDLGAASLHETSIYRSIAAFCARPMYKNHPHWRTLLAFASMAELGHDCNKVSANVLTAACELLRGSECPSRGKTANFKSGETSSRFVIPLNGNEHRPKKAINKFTDLQPEEFERGLEILEDATDDSSSSGDESSDATSSSADDSSNSADDSSNSADDSSDSVDDSSASVDDSSDSDGDSSDPRDDPNGSDDDFSDADEDASDFDGESSAFDSDEDPKVYVARNTASANVTGSRSARATVAGSKRKRNDDAHDGTSAKKPRTIARPVSLIGALKRSRDAHTGRLSRTQS